MLTGETPVGAVPGLFLAAFGGSEPMSRGHDVQLSPPL